MKIMVAYQAVLLSRPLSLKWIWFIISRASVQQHRNVVWTKEIEPAALKKDKQ
jgi:hypothetical protein